MRINLNLKDEIIQKIDKISNNLGINRTALISIVLSEYLKKNDNKEC